jgi:hypothetical protein
MGQSGLANMKINFLYKAIDDAQQTVKFTDTKTTMIFIFFGIYVSMIGTGLPDFAKYYWHMPESLQIIFIVTISVFLICIGCSLVLAIRVIVPRSNPASHIIMQAKPKEIYYVWKMNSGWQDGFADRNRLHLQTSFEDYYEKFNEIKDESEIEKELIYELLKISYIRELKIMRLKYMIRWAIIALVVSSVLVYLHFIGLSCHMPS